MKQDNLQLGRDVQMNLSHVWGVSRQYLLMLWKTPKIQEKIGCYFCFPHFHEVQLTYTVWHGLMGLGESAGRWLLTRVLQTFISLSGGKKAANDPTSPQTTVQQWGHVKILPPSLKHGDQALLLLLPDSILSDSLFSHASDTNEAWAFCMSRHESLDALALWNSLPCSLNRNISFTTLICFCGSVIQ